MPSEERAFEWMADRDFMCLHSDRQIKGFLLGPRAHTVLRWKIPPPAREDPWTPTPPEAVVEGMYVRIKRPDGRLVASHNWWVLVEPQEVSGWFTEWLVIVIEADCPSCQEQREKE